MTYAVICLTVLQLFLTIVFADNTSNVAKAFTKDKLVSKTVLKPPTQLIYVKYSNVSINLGTRVDILQTLTQPEISYKANDMLHYTLIFIGPDLPPAVKPPLKQFLHWLVVNIPGQNIPKGDIISSYFFPVPYYLEGLPYIFLRYKQNNTLDASNIPNMSVILNRFGFSVDKFAAKYNLEGPIAGSFMHQSYLKVVPEFEKYLFTVVTVLQLINSCYTASIMSNVAQAFLNDDVVSKVVKEPPKNLVMVNYSDTIINLGTTLQPLETLEQPTISYEANDDEFYTLMFFGPDLPPDIVPPITQLIHWLVVNIPGQDISKGHIVSSYFPPVPYPDGFPYIFLIYKQNGTLDTSVIPDMSNILQRPHFSASDFAEKYNISGPPIAGNFMRESYLEIVPQALQTFYNVLTDAFGSKAVFNKISTLTQVLPQVNINLGLF